MKFNNHEFKNDLVVEEIVRSVLPHLSTLNMYIPGKRGAVFKENSINPTRITVKCRLIEKTRKEVQQRVREIAGKLYSNEPAPLILHDEPNLMYMAVVTESTELEKMLYTGYFEVVFECADPFAHSEIKIYQINEPFINEGTFEALGIITLTAPSADEVHVHLGSGRGLTIIYPFDGTQEIIIDLKKQLVTLNGNNAMKYLTLESDFFSIPVGEVTIVSNAEGTISLKERYL